MKKIAIALALFPALTLTAQSDNTLYARQFAGADVGTKIMNAQLSCNPNSLIPCTIIIDASLATWTIGTMPTKCSQCSWVDYRNGLPYSPFTGIIEADTKLGSDFSAKVATSILLLASGPGGGPSGTIDARGFLTPQTGAATPFTGISTNSSFQLLMPETIVATAVPWTTPTGSNLHGISTNSLLRANPSLFPINSTLLQLGNSAGSCQSTRIENMALDLQNISGSVGVYTNCANELSGLERVWINNFQQTGVLVNPTGNSVGPQNWWMHNLYLIGGSTTGNASRGIDFEGSIDDARGIDNATVTTTSTTALQSCYEINGVNGFYSRLYAEACTDGLALGRTQQTVSVGAVGILGNDSGTPFVANTVHIFTPTSSPNESIALFNIGVTSNTHNGVLDSQNGVTAIGRTAEYILDENGMQWTTNPSVTYSFKGNGTYSYGLNRAMDLFALRQDASANGASYTFRHARGTTGILNGSTGALSGGTIVQSGDNLGTLVGAGYDGSTFQQAAAISINVDAAPGAGSMAGNIILSTTPSGSGTPVQAVKIASDQSISFAGNIKNSNSILIPSTATHGVLINCGTMTTTAAATNTLSCPWVTTSSNCTATQNSTATIVAWTAVVPTSGVVTVTHTATAGGTYAIACSAN